MRDLKTKYRLFQFEDGSILDVSKIDYITENPQATKYLIQINGHVLETDKDDEAERLIKTWDMYIRNEEQNAEHTYLHEKEMSAIISFLNKKKWILFWQRIQRYIKMRYRNIL